MRALAAIVLLLTSTAVLTVAMAAGGDAPIMPVRIFEITGGGKVQHVHFPGLGDKTFVTKANKKTIPLCIQGSKLSGGFQGDCDSLQNNADGKAYLYIYTSRLWGVATDSNPNTAAVTQLTGLTDGKGKFMFSGFDGSTGTTFLVEGKAKLDKDLGDDLIPKGVKGKLRAVTSDGGHIGVSSIKSGKPLEL
ncbi:MAG: hypothetical protein DRQ55_04760 [Planctomycetota bacterium]|nr:MAG: hypothetical protein DRQ55_04760 [Planctomycetota bacterium]